MNAFIVIGQLSMASCPVQTSRSVRDFIEGLPATGFLIARLLVAPAYAYAGVVHLHAPTFFMRIVSSWVPVPTQTVFATGACEIAGANCLLIPETRRLAGAMLAPHAVCIFPANIKHAIDDLSSGTGLTWRIAVSGKTTSRAGRVATRRIGCPRSHLNLEGAAALDHDGVATHDTGRPSLGLKPEPRIWDVLT